MAHKVTAKLRASSLIQAMSFERILCLASFQSQCPINTTYEELGTIKFVRARLSACVQTKCGWDCNGCASPVYCCRSPKLRKAVSSCPCNNVTEPLHMFFISNALWILARDRSQFKLRAIMCHCSGNRTPICCVRPSRWWQKS